MFGSGSANIEVMTVSLAMIIILTTKIDAWPLEELLLMPRIKVWKCWHFTNEITEWRSLVPKVKTPSSTLGYRPLFRPTPPAPLQLEQPPTSQHPVFLQILPQNQLILKGFPTFISSVITCLHLFRPEQLFPGYDWSELDCYLGQWPSHLYFL